MNATAKLVTTAAVPGLLAIAVVMAQMQGERGVTSLSLTDHPQQNPCDLIPLQSACKPSGFDVVGYCGAQCLDPEVKGRRCVIDVIWYSDVIAPDPITVESWWVIRSVSDGRRYYIWGGRFGLAEGRSRQRYELCSDCDAAIEALGMQFPDETRQYRVWTEVVTNDCINCRSPTPDPGWPVLRSPSYCMKPIYLPLASYGFGSMMGTATFTP